jgi:hypothetical protein
LIFVFLDFYRWRGNNGNTVGDDFESITEKEFDAFRISPDYITDMHKMTYGVSNRTTTSRCKPTLVDLGENDACLGNDECVPTTNLSNCEVDIEKLDNHCMTSVEIVSDAGHVNTHKDQVVVHMQQYDNVANGPTIHSCGQMEWFGHTVNDNPVEVGGTQSIETGNEPIISSTDCELNYTDDWGDNEHLNLAILEAHQAACTSV